MTSAANSLPLIDAHAHVHPHYAPALAAAMDANGVRSIVNLGIVEALDLPFDESLRTFRRIVGERMAYFTTPDFRDMAPGFGERMAHDLRLKVAAGARGLKIFKELGLRHKDADGRLIAVDDARLDPLWARAGELGVPVLIHTADPVSFFQPLDEHNESREELQKHPDWHFGTPEFPTHATLLAQFNRVLERHPTTVFIGAHVGHYSENLAYVDACLQRYPNYYVDTTSRISELGRQPTGQVRAFFVKNQDRVLLGTDLTIGWDAFECIAPDAVALKQFYDLHRRFFETDDQQIDHPFPIAGRWKVNGLGLPEEVLEKLYFRNAQRLIPGW